MDLGIAGRTAIVCASSRGLGRACAFALAEAGCHVIVNGRDAAVVQATADEIKAKTGAKVTAVAADVATPEGQAALFAAAPEPDILVNNNAGPPPRDFRELTRQQMLDGVTANMVIAIELMQKAIGPMTAKKFGRIVNITSGTVKLPQAGLDLSSAARGGLTIFLAGVAPLGRRQQRDHQQPPAGRVRDRPAQDRAGRRRQAPGQELRGRARRAHRQHSGQAPRRPRRLRRDLRVPVLGAGRLHHRAEHHHRRRRLSGRVLVAASDVDRDGRM